MSKLSLTSPRKYDAGVFQELLTRQANQANLLAEGKAVARHDSRTAAPTAGNWQRGDIIWNSEPTAGGFIGFVCVTSGTPGTWRTWGAISA